MWRYMVPLNLSWLPQVSQEQGKHTRSQHAVCTIWWRRRTNTTAKTNQLAHHWALKTGVFIEDGRVRSSGSGIRCDIWSWPYLLCSVLPEKETEIYGRCAGPNYRPRRQAARNWPDVRARKAVPEGAHAFVLNLPVPQSATAHVNSTTVRKTTVFQLVQHMCINWQLSNIWYRFPVVAGSNLMLLICCLNCWLRHYNLFYIVLLMHNIDTDAHTDW